MCNSVFDHRFEEGKLDSKLHSASFVTGSVYQVLLAAMSHDVVIHGTKVMM
jgi:hypothetical protein